MLESNRLILRKWEQEDLNDLYDIISNKKVAELAGFSVKTNINEANEILKMFIKEPSNSLWAIELKEINKVVGWIEVHKPIDNIYIDAKEIGFVLSELYWGQGMAKEAINNVVNYTFIKEEVSSIICSHFKNNIQSKKVIEKCGFKYQLEYNDKLYYSLKKKL